MSATPTMEHLDLPITGMTCASCANRIERRLNKIEGVEATVNFATERATVDYDPALTDPDALLGAVEAVGYRAALPVPERATGSGDAIRLSRATLRTIEQNLGWAFGYIIAALLLAAMGLLNPVVAGAAMAFSSVSVVANALRLRRFETRRASPSVRR